MYGDIKGIVKIQRQFDGAGVRSGSGMSNLMVTFLVELSAGQHEGGVSSNTQHWLKEEDIVLQPKFVIEKDTIALLKEVGDRLRRGDAAYPSELLECIKADGKKKAGKRRETDTIGERPQLVRAKSLEDQMLQQSGYGARGKSAKLHALHETSKPES